MICEKNSFYYLSVIAAVYGVVIYSISFSLEMWFIITNNRIDDEASDSIPIFAFILAAIYFVIVIVSLVLLLGIIIRSLMCLMSWLITFVVVFFPECGLVLYTSIYKWGLDSRNGQLELFFYVIRGISNVFFVVCVQSLLSQWKTEKQVSCYATSLSSGFNSPSSPYIDTLTTSTTINPVYKNPAAGHFPTSEFDPRNFHDVYFISGSTNPQESPQLTYSTQSLDRKKGSNKLKHSNSFKEEVILRPLNQRPFEYLQRPGSLYDIRFDHDYNPRSHYYSESRNTPKDIHERNSSNQSVRDVAL